MKEIPAVFVYAGSRIYQNVIKKHFNEICRLKQPLPYSLAAGFTKGVLFYEYVGYNISGLDTVHEIINQNLADTNLFLIIDDSYEGLASYAELKKLKTLIDANRKNISDWMFISSNAGLKKLMQDVFGSANNFLYYNIHLKLDRYDNIDCDLLDHNINNKLRSKKFLCVNRHERLHRLKTIDFIIKKDILKDSYASCMLGISDAILDESIQADPNDFVPGYYDDNLDINCLEVETKQRLKNYLPIELDVKEARNKILKANMPSLEKYFDDSYLSIVTEGDFSAKEGKRQFTEKVVKCFAFHHPFIVVGLPNTLELLQEEGFLTFSEIIDESYDSIEDDDLRLSAALQEVERLSKMNIHELKACYEQVIPVLEHNYNLYKKKIETASPSLLINRIMKWYSYNH